MIKLAIYAVLQSPNVALVLKMEQSALLVLQDFSPTQLEPIV
jgi:hypothetical protein